jgi:hypothetical protein
MNLTADTYSVFVLLLALFTLGATFLAAYSFANTVRLRNVRLSWKSGKLFGYPLFSTLFLVSTGIVGGWVFFSELDAYYTILGSYSWMGLCWFISSYFSSKAYITDHGIVKNINDPSQTIAWHQVDDYVEKPAEKGIEYVFIYHEKRLDEGESQRLIRLELFVPDKKSAKFDKLVSLKIGKTMTSVSDTSFDIKAFD